ncbi:hypothetical protein FBU30_004963 [Linnemannia zychae]|nr:hypothetical protein FBU30_004963 [Linnemannia zychae]
MGAKNRFITSRLTGPLQILFMLMLPLFTLAQVTQPPPPNSTQPNQPPNGRQPDVVQGWLGDPQSQSLTWQRIVAGAVLILIGLLLTFRGYRHYRFTMFLAGFITGCVVVYSILVNVEPARGWDWRQVIYVFSCLGGGLLLGLICFALNRFTVWILGGLAGLATALYILAWRSEGLIRNRAGRIGLLAGAPALGIILALIMGRRILIPASAIVGAYLSVIGLDLFARTGFASSIPRFFTKNNSVDYHLNTNLYIFLGIIGGLILLGTLFQTLAWRHRQQSLIAQGRSLHNHDNDWSLCGSRYRGVRPDPTYPNGSYTAPGTLNNNQDVYRDNNATATTYTNAQGYNGTMHVDEKKPWNPFKKSKPDQRTSTVTTTTTAYPNNTQPNNTQPNNTHPNSTPPNNTYPNKQERRVSYGSQAALNHIPDGIYRIQFPSTPGTRDRYLGAFGTSIPNTPHLVALFVDNKTRWRVINNNDGSSSVRIQHVGTQEYLGLDPAKIKRLTYDIELRKEGQGGIESWRLNESGADKGRYYIQLLRSVLLIEDPIVIADGAGTHLGSRSRYTKHSFKFIKA